MDPTKHSLSSKATTPFNDGGGSDVTQPEEAVEEWRNGGERERQREVEREAGVTEPVTLAAETPTNHRVSADKHRFRTVGYQRKLKQKVVADYTTVSKGASGNFKPRAALRQVLFSQGAPEKSPMPEAFNSETDNFKLPYGGHQYHASCANFWINCVEPKPPGLILPDLL